MEGGPSGVDDGRMQERRNQELLRLITRFLAWQTEERLIRDALDQDREEKGKQEHDRGQAKFGPLEHVAVKGP